MGEIAEMMLDGTLCEGCGVYMEGEGGYLRLCAECATDRRKAGREVIPNGPGEWLDAGPRAKNPPQQPKAKCPTCGKKVKAAGLNDHARDVHGERSTPRLSGVARSATSA